MVSYQSKSVCILYSPPRDLLLTSPTFIDIYHLAFKKDGIYTRSFVYALYAVETAQTIIATNDAFNTYARNFGNVNILILVQNIWISVPLLTGIGVFETLQPLDMWPTY